MPNIKSAVKRVDIIRRKTLRNIKLKSSLRTTIKRFDEALNKGKEDSSLKLHSALVAIDKAVTKGILHKNTAARKKSRLTRRFNNQDQA
ncbi:MAG: 30S ribosomal protein S20 [Desulfocucumaceae bacterium]